MNITRELERLIAKDMLEREKNTLEFPKKRFHFKFEPVFKVPEDKLIIPFRKRKSK